MLENRELIEAVRSSIHTAGKKKKEKEKEKKNLCMVLVSLSLLPLLD